MSISEDSLMLLLPSPENGRKGQEFLRGVYEEFDDGVFMVKIDGDQDSIPIRDSLVSPADLEEDCRVVILRQRERQFILGRSGGIPSGSSVAAATQSEVNQGLIEDKYVSPKTLKTRPEPGKKLLYKQVLGQTVSIGSGGNIVALGGDAALVDAIEVDSPTEVLIELKAHTTTSNMQIGSILSGATSHAPGLDGIDVGIASSGTAYSRLLIILQPGVTTITLGRRSGAANGTVRNPSLLITAV